MYPKSFIDYLVYFHSFRDYFECHEVLEEYWKEQGKNNQVWVGLIQLAVANYHQRRGNYRGANKLIEQSLKILSKEEKQITALGLNWSNLILTLSKKRDEIAKQLPYKPISFTLSDQKLLEECQKAALKMGVDWSGIPDVDDYIIHKHKQRDRSSIIKERQQQLSKRKQK